MASIMRCARLFGKFKSFSHLNNNIYHWKLIQPVTGNALMYERLLSTPSMQSDPQPLTNDSRNLDRYIQKVDQDIRRTGRITRKEIEEIVDEIREQRRATSTQSLLVIRCCGSLVPEEAPETRTKLVQNIWNTLEKLNVPMDLSHYNALLRVYLENEHKFSPTDFLSTLEQKGLEPNRVTYQRLIARYCQEGDIEGATKILEYMKEKQLPINEHVFNALIMGHTQTGDMESAKGIIGVMQQAGLEPSSDTYATIICGYASQGDMDSIRKVLSECREKEFALYDRDILECVYVLTVHKHTEHVPEMLSLLRRSVGYNQDAVNLILRLVNLGEEEVAYKVLLCMPPPSRNDGGIVPPTGGFIIRQMVRANRPKDAIISMCNRLKSDQVNPYGILKAAETAIAMGHREQSLELLEVLYEEQSNTGISIRPHFFWPLLIKNAHNEQGIFDIIYKMLSLNSPPNIETLRDYIIPFIGGAPDRIVAKLRATGLLPSTIIGALMQYLMHEKGMKTAAILAQGQRVRVSSGPLRRAMSRALVTTGDVVSYTQLLSYTCESEMNYGGVSDVRDIVDRYVADSLIEDKSGGKWLSPLLQSLSSEGLGISNSTAALIQDNLGEKLTVEITDLISKLTSPDLQFVHKGQTSQGKQEIGNWESRSIHELESLLSSMKNQNRPVRHIMKQLFTAYCRAKESTNAERMREEIETDNYTLPTGLLAQQLDMYVQQDNLSDAKLTLKDITERESDFILDDLKIIRLAGLMVKEGKKEEAIELLSSHPRERRLEDRSALYKGQCWKILNILAEAGDENGIKDLLKILLERDYVRPSNAIFGPLVKVHLLKDDIASAVSEFERLVNEHKCTPWKNEVMCKLINLEDSDRLQKVMDLSTQVHGEVNSLYDLVLSFIECGRTRQARKIMETPGLRARNEKLEWSCQKLLEEGKIDKLETFVAVTKDVFDTDRSMMYHYLLKAYSKEDDVDKALSIWTSLQEEDFPASSELLRDLAQFLKSKGKVVPFVIPEHQESYDKITNINMDRIVDKNAPASLASPRRESRTDRDRRQMERRGVDASVSNLSAEIEEMLRSGRLGEAIRIGLDLFSKGQYPYPRIMRMLLGKVAHSGDVDGMKQFEPHLTPELKRMVSYDNNLCLTHGVAGKGKAYLEGLENDIDSATAENLTALKEKFPRGGAVGLLERSPELVPYFTQIATKYATKGILAPMNVLWMYHFSVENFDEANKIYDAYLKQLPNIMYRNICSTAMRNNSPSLIEKLIQQLTKEDCTVEPRSLGSAYSYWIDLHCNEGRYSEGLAVINNMPKDMSLQNIHQNSLLRLKDGLSKQGLDFPHNIPQQKTSNRSSSSSSSDDEGSQKR